MHPIHPPMFNTLSKPFVKTVDFLPCRKTGNFNWGLRISVLHITIVFYNYFFQSIDNQCCNTAIPPQALTAPITLTCNRLLSPPLFPFFLHWSLQRKHWSLQTYPPNYHPLREHWILQTRLAELSLPGEHCSPLIRPAELSPPGEHCAFQPSPQNYLPLGSTAPYNPARRIISLSGALRLSTRPAELSPPGEHCSPLIRPAELSPSRKHCSLSNRPAALSPSREHCNLLLNPIPSITSPRGALQPST